MKLRNIFENPANYPAQLRYKAYHGSNSDHIREFTIRNPDSADKDGALFFTDSYDYAKHHGNYVYVVTLTPEHILTESSLTSLSDDIIINTLEQLYNKNIDQTLRNEILNTVEKQFKEYATTGNVSQLFAGLGGFRVIKALGFDMIVVDNDSEKFFLVLNASIVNIDDVKRVIA